MAQGAQIRQTPEIEKNYQRGPELGYEPDDVGLLRFLEHGAPHPLIRWHIHDEYELHLITNTHGKVFVGDYIGQFGPGQLVLTGPRLPHNWITTDYGSEGEAPLRDRALQFGDTPIRDAAKLIPELQTLLPLLDRAKNGIEFFGISNQVSVYLDQIKESVGSKRLAVFIELMTELAHHNNYRLLSSAQIQSEDDQQQLDQVNDVVEFITSNYAEPFSMAEVAERFGMSESRFSRYFRRSTGNTFTDFVNRVRVNKACQLLLESEKYISTICYEVGFNNVANFNRRFSEFRGMTPSEFRKTGKLRY